MLWWYDTTQFVFKLLLWVVSSPQWWLVTHINNIQTWFHRNNVTLTTCWNVFLWQIKNKTRYGSNFTDFGIKQKQSNILTINRIKNLHILKIYQLNTKHFYILEIQKIQISSTSLSKWRKCFIKGIHVLLCHKDFMMSWFNDVFMLVVLLPPRH